MAEFLGDLAFMFEVFVLGVGLVVLYFANKEDSKLLKASGWIMSVVAVLGMACTGYFYMKYFFAGGFDTPYPKHHMMQQMMRDGMKKDGMMGRMMKGRRMDGQGMMMKNMQHCMTQMQGKTMGPQMMQKVKGCMMGQGTMKNKEMSKEEHESHHKQE